MKEQTEEDIAQVGLPSTTDKLLKELAELPWFDEEQDIYKIGVCIALARGLTPKERSDEGFDKKFRAVLLDNKYQDLRKLILMLTPKCGSRPYHYSQFLAVAGISYLHQILVVKRRTLAEAFELEATDATTTERHST